MKSSLQRGHGIIIVVIAMAVAQASVDLGFGRQPAITLAWASTGMSALWILGGYGPADLLLEPKKGKEEEEQQGKRKKRGRLRQIM